MRTIEEKLQAPFNPEDIEWKPQTAGISGGGMPYVLAVPYITNRAIQKRLDEVFGVLGWSNEFKPSTHEKGYLCGITVNLDGRTVTKWDGAEATQIEPLKGGLSNSMKRAAVQLGIGRYLYELPDMWAEKCIKCGNKRMVDGYQNIIKKGKNNNENIAWNPPSLPEWALPVEDFNSYGSAIEAAKTMDELKEAFKTAWNVARINQNEEQKEAFKKIYEAQKAQIEQAKSERELKTLEEISIWVESRAKELGYLPNKDTIDSIYEKSKAVLKNKMAGHEMDKDYFYNRLHEIYLQALKALEEKKGKVNV